MIELINIINNKCKNIILSVLILQIFSFNCISQPNTTCQTALPLCVDTIYPPNSNFLYPIGTTGTAQTGPFYGCMTALSNQIWYYTQALSSSSILSFNINTTNSQPLGAVGWGPFSSLSGICTQLTSNNIITCNTGTFISAYVPNPIAGQYYVFCITNPSGASGNLFFTENTGNTGATVCDVFTNNGPLCIGDTLVFTDLCPHSGNTYSWSGPNGFTSTLMNPVINNVSGANAGVYTIVVTSGSQTTTVHDTVIVNSNPVPAISGNYPVCSGSTLNLHSSLSTLYSWSGPAGFTSSIQNPVISNVTTANNGTYYLTITNAAGCTASTSTSVTIYSPPPATAGSNSPLCAGTALHLTSSGGITYLWSGPNSFTSTQQNPTITSATTNATGIYSVTVTDSHNCTATASTTVFINPIPVATASNNGPVCAGTTLSLNSTGGTTYSWSGPNSFTSNLQNPSISNVTAANAGVYTVTVTGSGCTATATTTVTVKPKPSTPVLTSNSPFCAGSALNLTANSTAGSTYQWSGPASFTSTAQNPVITNTTTSNAGTYTAYANLNGCLSNAATIIVTINPSPSSAFSVQSPICLANSSLIQATSQAGVTYSWNFGGGTILSGTGAGPYQIHWTTIGTPTVTLTVTSTSAPFCSSTTSHSLTIVSNTTPGCCINPTPNAGISQVVCGLTCTMQASSPGAGNTTVWVQYSGPGSSVFGNNTGNTSSVTVSQPGQYVYQWMEISGSCNGSDTVTIRFVSQPNSNAGVNKDTCGLTCHLHAFPSSGTGSWSGNGTFAIPASPTSLVTVTSGGIRNFIWTETITMYGRTCTDKDTVAVNFHPIPTPNAGSNASSCGNKYFLHGSLPATGNTGQWSQISGGGTSSFSNYQSNVTMVTVSVLGTYRYQWRESNGWCYGTSTVDITFIQIPNAYAGPDGTVCGKTYSLHATPSIGSGIWTGTGTFNPVNSSPTPTVTVGNFGIYTYIWTETNTVSGTTCSDADSVKATFVQAPVPNAGNNSSACGQTANLHAISTFAGYWTGPAGAVYSPSNTNPNATVNILPYTTLSRSEIFYWHEANGSCTGIDNVTITFMKLPHAEAGTGGSTCDSLFSLHSDTLGSGAVGGYWFTWSPGVTVKPYNSIYATGSVHNVIPNIYGDSSYVNIWYYWGVQNSASCVGKDSVKVTYYQVPHADAGANDSICGKQYTLDGAYSIGESIGQWRVVTKPPSASANFVTAASPTSKVNVSHYGTYTFEWREINQHNSSCDSRDTVKVVFLSIPNIDAGDDTSICGMYVQLSATTSGGTGTWYSNSGGVSWWNQPNGSSGPSWAAHSSTWARYSSQNDTVMFIWQEYNSLCVARDSMYVYFATLQPAVPLVADADSVTCGLSFDRLNAQPPSYGNGYWIDTVPNTHFFPYPLPGANNPSPDSAVTAYYGMHHFYWVTHNGACRDTSEVIPVQFIHKPNANAGGHYRPGLFGTHSRIKTDTACGFVYNLHAVPSFGTGTWSCQDAANTWFNQHGPGFQTTSRYNDTVNTSILSYNTNPNYRQFTWIENDKGCTDADTLRLMFAPIPNGLFTFTMPSCKGDSSILIAKRDPYNANNYGLTHFYWSFGNNTRFDSDTSHFVKQDTIIARWTSGFAHIVRLITVNKYLCNSGIFADTINEPPTLTPQNTITPTTCHQSNGKIVLHNINNSYQFTWDNTFPAIHRHDTIQSNLSNKYYVILVYGESISPDAQPGTFCRDSLKILVPDTGEVTAMFDTLAFLDTIHSVDPRIVTFANQTIGGNSYQWIFYDINGNKIGDSNLENPTITFHRGAYKVVLISKSRQNCVDSIIYKYLIVRNQSTIEVPNVFTPNGDGVNDEFIIKNQTLKDFHCIIFNRWGVKVFEWNNPAEGWKGTTTNGGEAMSGVYFYIITGTGEDKTNYVVKGSFELFRDSK